MKRDSLWLLYYQSYLAQCQTQIMNLTLKKNSKFPFSAQKIELLCLKMKWYKHWKKWMRHGVLNLSQRQFLTVCRSSWTSSKPSQSRRANPIRWFSDRWRSTTWSCCLVELSLHAKVGTLWIAETEQLHTYHISIAKNWTPHSEVSYCSKVVSYLKQLAFSFWYQKGEEIPLPLLVELSVGVKSLAVERRQWH